MIYSHAFCVLKSFFAEVEYEVKSNLMVITDREKVVYPSNLVASRILDWQYDFDQVSQICNHLDQTWIFFTISGLILFNFGSILAIFGEKV